MILDQICLENVGLYAGRQTLNLTPKGPDQPIILVGGFNGGGKTTLLESIHLGLYGRRAVVVQRGRRSYLELLRTLIHRRATPSEGSAIEINFRRLIEGKSHQISVTRRWKIDEKENVVESVEARRDGSIDHMLGEQWEEYIEGYLPAQLAPLFFFDGEQVEELADPEAAASLISLAVQALLGLDLVDRLRDDLAVLSRRKRLTNRTATERAQLETLKTEFDLAEANVTAIKEEVARNLTVREQLAHDKDRLLEKFAAEGGDLFIRRNELESDRAKIATSVARCESQIRLVADGPAPLLIVGRLLKKTERQAEKEVASAHQKIVADAEAERDRIVIERLKLALSQSALIVVETTLKETRPTTLSDVRTILSTDSEFPERLRALGEHVLPRCKVELADATNESRIFRRKLDAMDKQLARVPDADQLARIQNEIAKIDVELRDSENQRVVLTDRHRIAEYDTRMRGNALEKALESANSEIATAEHDRRILDRIPVLDSTLSEFRRKVVAKHAGKLERLILESFQQLVRKPLLVKEIHLDPEHFTLTLTGGDDKPLPIDRLSAGERQLLATSILWGLAKASGRPVPTIIDTPLGRLDSSHRDHLVERYFPIASHQVILLSTDEEIDAKRLSQLRPSITAMFTLSFDPKGEKTEIVRGYFGNETPT